MDKVVRVNGTDYEIIKLLGHGKGGYSYLACSCGEKVVLKQIHHEPCDYYTFGNKIESEKNDYKRLREAGIRIPAMLSVDDAYERIVKEYIDGPVIFDMVRDGVSVEPYIVQIREMAELAKNAGINIDYFPTNFVVQDNLIYYVDYECNQYMDEWNFENWGIKYWSRTPEFEEYLKTHQDLGRAAMMMLIEPTIEYDRQIGAYRKEFLDCGDSMDGTGELRRFENPQDWIEYLNRHKNPLTVPEGRVPSTQYMFLREEDRKIVGMLDVRHHLNDYLKKFGGHIGYSVAPSERHKGYAALMLKMALPKCKELGIEKVLITCISGNEGSKRTILRNGGIFDSIVYEPDEGVNLERYWIDLSQSI